LHDSEDVTGREHEVLDAVVLHLGSAVARVENDISDCDIEGNAVPVVVDAAGADGNDGSLLGLFFGRVGDDDSRRGDLLSSELLDDNAIFERLDCDRHG
ncbi:MAG: hypothetical protein RLZZ587_780, partial [Actinomycetota bacterium]